ncbi:YgiQ family radical SAM protein [candidate division KSB3 bacterium]|uniref:YgiQ family radical SAM protein n=1 Tax=candidate division KSB3 bacterium TaxID=2044937 RepID=A0A2G6KL22_9BACT|nr:MAG: YgiQ family radical SAM protein [candidate division KSB3 bacterium]
MNFLPISPKDMRTRGWDELDVVLVTGDAYVDHPAFGTAVIGRVLEHHGYRVGIIAMPDWNDPDSVTIFGKPRLFFGVTSGNVDSMLARYTAFKRYRSDDPYVPGGQAGRKPERAVLTYCNLIKAAYKEVPLVIGGVEASMRRVAHYDFWSNKVRRSILEDSRADILVYGMGEQAITSIAKRLEISPPGSPSQKGRIADCRLHGIPGTVVISKAPLKEAQILPSEEDVLASKKTFTQLYRIFYREQQSLLAQPTGKRYLLHYPAVTLSPEKLDAIYDLPFTRQPHPSYKETIPAFEMIRHSITAHRGCVSGCSFCSLGLHQGKKITSRSQQSVIKEAEKIAASPGFKGHITDVGGPSANMYGFDCRRDWNCGRESCLFPSLCPNLKITTRKWLQLLQQVEELERVSRVTIGSGIRYDLLLRDPEYKRALQALITKHISGQLKIAPEHTDPKVLRAMRKSPIGNIQDFVTCFREVTARKGKEQYPLPYVMSCHPGSTQKEMAQMKNDITATFKFLPQQVQAFIPLPMTLSSVIYYTGVDPLTGEQFEVVRDMNERRKQHQIFFEPAPQQRKRSVKKRMRKKRTKRNKS